MDINIDIYLLFIFIYCARYKKSFTLSRCLEADSVFGQIKLQNMSVPVLKTRVLWTKEQR